MAHKSCDPELFDQFDQVDLLVELPLPPPKHSTMPVFQLAADADSYHKLLPPCEVEIRKGL